MTARKTPKAESQMAGNDLKYRKNQVESEGIGPVAERSYTPSRLVIHEHEADKAGKHFDIRINVGNKAVSFATRKGLPTKGKPVELFRQPDHVVSYMDWEGEIPKGEYGAGKVKKSVDLPVVIKSSPEYINVNIPSGENKGNYVFMKKNDSSWLAVRKNDLDHYWAPKPKYKESPVAEDDSSKYFVTEKLDGAHFIAVVNPNGISFTSQRKSKSGDIITKEDNVPHLRDIKLPKEYHGMIIRGELWHDKGFNTLSGILNSLPRNAVEQQLSKGLVRFAPFKIEKIPGQETPLAYEQQYDLLKKLSKDLPYYFEPPKKGEQGFKALFDEVGAAKGEGIVLVDKMTGDNIKMKHRFDYDLKIDSFTAGTGKYEGKAIGAINLVDKNGKSAGKVGTGISDSLRVDMYKNPGKYIGKIVRVTSRKPLLDKLREPSFEGFAIDKDEADEVK